MIDRETTEPPKYLYNPSSWNKGRLLAGNFITNENEFPWWTSMDSRESYLEKEHRIDEYYKTREISYCVNQQRFRCYKEVEDYVDDYFIAFGCSETFGIGNAVEDLWPNLLADKVDKECLNLGIPGSGLTQHFFNTLMYLENYEQRPAFVVIQHPGIYRRMLAFKEENEIRIETDYDFELEQHQYEVEHHGLVTDYVNSAMMSIAIDRLWASQGVDVFHFTAGYDGYSPYYPLLNIAILDFARDCAHMGWRTHEKIAKIMYATIRRSLARHDPDPGEQEPETEHGSGDA